MENTIARESRRANKKVAKKRIAKASLEKSEAIQGAVAGMIIDPFKPKPVVNCIVNSAVNKFLFEEDEEVYSRK